MIFVIYSGPKGHAPSVWVAGNLEASAPCSCLTAPALLAENAPASPGGETR